jgi:hypothetical protein
VRSIVDKEMTMQLTTVRETRAAGLDFPGVLRGVTAAAVLLTADVHLQLWFAGFRAIHLIGPLFMLNCISGLLIGVAVVSWRRPLSALAAVLYGAGTLAAFLISVNVGLFGFQEVFSGTPQALAGVSEVVAVVAGVATLALGRVGRSS